MPWRAAPGIKPDPYHVWLSEIMLQQTSVTAVIPYFSRFIEAYPEITDLAAARDEDVLGLWAGLGYYARARNLIVCARQVAARPGFPETLDGLRKLPGVGQYTAAAIGAIAFRIPAIPVDGNVERVTARLFAIDAPLPGAKPAIATAAAQLGAQPSATRHPGDFAQALFDLGATICTPRNPSCTICPWRMPCRAAALGLAGELPRRGAKSPRPVRYGTVFLLRDRAGRIGLRRRPPKGLLGGMLELPGTDWTSTTSKAAPPARTRWRQAATVVHVFTHFELRLTVHAASVAKLPDGLMASVPDIALPTLMKKAVKAGLLALEDTAP